MTETLKLAVTPTMYCIAIYNDTGPIVTIELDGTVTRHQEGKDAEAARLFYDSLQIEGTTLRSRIAVLEREVEALRARDKECAEVAIENAELRALVAGAQLDDGPCYYCGRQTNSLAGNPAEWCIVLSHADEPGVSKAHHAGCINERLAAATRPVEGEEVAREIQDLRGTALERVKT